VAVRVDDIVVVEDVVCRDELWAELHESGLLEKREERRGAHGCKARHCFVSSVSGYGRVSVELHG
jgi:hypothetical protein